MKRVRSIDFGQEFDLIGWIALVACVLRCLWFSWSCNWGLLAAVSPNFVFRLIVSCVLEWGAFRQPLVVAEL